ncbi:hypothetical protein HMPREF1084_01948 [Clostridium butyricum 60E.3]|uniref:hypothetical protein n=1 Tax=Clostridium butyricum TaxID=1492 RepID=UPI0002D1CBCE|nr:hypothetical protein [Clostridium butyricum]ENZ33479.1 hypothetical protein HMPREF1084_01948 [Clostridium butyricum 60E.3]
MKEINLISIVITIITSIIAIFNLKQKTEERLQDEYFKDILLEYFRIKNINPKIDVCEFVNKYTFKKTCIPNYIFYLADPANEKITDGNDNKNVLEQIMIVDYWINTPNMGNYISRIIYSLLNTGLFIFGIILVSIMLIGISLIVLYIVLCIRNILYALSCGQDISYSLILANNSNLLFGAVLLLGGSLALNISRKIEVERLNIYTSNKKSIRSIIKNKVRMYRKMTKKNYFPIKGTSER